MKGFRVGALIALVLGVRSYLEELKIEFIENPRELTMFRRHTTKKDQNWFCLSVYVSIRYVLCN